MSDAGHGRRVVDQAACVQDVENIAWKIGFVLNGRATNALLDSYATKRRAAAEENLRVTGATTGFLVSQSERGSKTRRRTLERKPLQMLR
ncbi:MAG: hypothetical protein GY720_23145 [bacterium]|nr:hypothetical protein [bacterium]